jgi:hypothetical protein
VSYESELLRDFSLCILQKNNIFECKAEIPSIPYVEPMRFWRGKEVTTDVARGIMIGHLEGVNESLEVGRFVNKQLFTKNLTFLNQPQPALSNTQGCQDLDVSWKVVCGANVAYDQFPSQNQVCIIYLLFYCLISSFILCDISHGVSSFNSYSILMAKEKICGMIPCLELKLLMVETYGAR